MSSTKLCKLTSGTATPAKKDAVSLRRSCRISQKAVEDEKHEMPRKKRNPSYKKKQQLVDSEEEEELQQNDLNPFVKELSQKSGTQTLGICTTPNTDSDHDKQPQAEPVDIPSSPEETKPNVDLLWMLEPALKPYSDDGIPTEDLKQLSVAASIIKSDMVSRLTSSTDQLSIEDMIKHANDCFNSLRTLRDRKLKSFHGEVCKLIEGHQKLKLVAAEKENWTDSDIKAQYIKQMDLLTEATEKLQNVQNYLSRAKMRRDSLNSRKNELTTLFFKLVDELKAEEERISTLTAKWNQCKEDRYGVAAEVEKLGSWEKEAAERLDAINTRYEAAKEEIEKMKNDLLHLVSKQ